MLPVHKDDTPPVDDEKTEAKRTLGNIRIWVDFIPSLLAALAIFTTLYYDHPEWVLYEWGFWVVAMVAGQVALAWTAKRWGVELVVEKGTFNP